MKEVSPCDNSGILYHRSRRGVAIASWNRGYFVLSGSNFYGFKSKDSHKADLFIHLPGFTCSVAEEVKSKDFSFKIYHTGNLHVYNNFISISRKIKVFHLFLPTKRFIFYRHRLLLRRGFGRRLTAVVGLRVYGDHLPRRQTRPGYGYLQRNGFGQFGHGTGTGDLFPDEPESKKVFGVVPRPETCQESSKLSFGL